MPAYDGAHFDPPAPVAIVTLRDPRSGAMVTDVHLLLDTGADVTLLPVGAVERLGIAPLAGQQYELTGFDGSKTVVPAVLADTLFLNRAYRGRYLLIQGEQGILGRDILNHLPLLLDGPREEWSEYRR